MGDKVWVENQADCTVLVQTECNDVQYQKCDLVTHDGCQDQPWNHCQDVPYQHCEPVHKLVSKQTSQKKPFRVCNGNDKPYEFTQQEIADYDLIDSVDYSVINARQGESDEDQVDVDTGLRTV